MTSLILHQYDRSPFSAKVRVILGIKGLHWAACDQPVIMPKPELVPLTGGYRRIPVLQIGADVWCDSRAIIDQLERVAPEPSVYGDRPGVAKALAAWADRAFFQLAVVLVFGGGYQVDEAFAKDREALSGRPFDAKAMAAALPVARAQIAAHLAGFDAQLQSGDAFLLGPSPAAADAALYHNLHFVGRTEITQGYFERFPALAAWFKRVRALGHGRRTEVTREEALRQARESEPAAPPPHAPLPSDPEVGARVAVMADDYGRDPIAGVLASAGPDHITLARETPETGRIHTHFPRAGFVLGPA